MVNNISGCRPYIIVSINQVIRIWLCLKVGAYSMWMCLFQIERKKGVDIMFNTDRGKNKEILVKKVSWKSYS